MADTPTAAKVEEQLPKKGEIAPLEGALGPEIVTAAKVCYMGMTVPACQNLALTAGTALTSPLMSGQQLAEMTPQAAAAAAQPPSLLGGGDDGPQQTAAQRRQPQEGFGNKPDQKPAGPKPEEQRWGRGFGGLIH